MVVRHRALRSDATQYHGYLSFHYPSIQLSLPPFIHPSIHPSGARLREEQRLVVEPVAHSAQLRDVRHELGMTEHIAEDLAVRLLPEEHAAHVKARPGGIEW